MIPYISLAFMGGFLIGRSRIRLLRRSVSRKTVAD